MAPLHDLYQLLGLSAKRNNGQTISSDELRQAYKRTLLSYHPDKRNSTNLTQSKGAVAITVDEIAEAYRVLGNAASRAQYDRELFRKDDFNDLAASSNSNNNNNIVITRHTGMETVDLEELSPDEDSGMWTRPCRCGSEPAFVVTEAELEKHVEYGELITGCKGCSLWLKVMFTVED